MRRWLAWDGGSMSQATVIRNPIVHRITITSDCPEGSYRLKSVIQDSSGNEIISGSIDFDIGEPRPDADSAQRVELYGDTELSFQSSSCRLGQRRGRYS